MSRAGLQLVVTGHASNAQAFTNCAYVHPSDMEKLAEAAGQPAEVVKDKGLICAVGEAVFTIKPYDHYKPGSIGVGMMQRMAGNLPLDAGVPVTPFSPPRGNFAMASVQLEVDLLKKTQEATLDAQEVAAFLHKTFHNHVFKVGQTFAGGFQDGAVGLKLTVRGFEYIDLGAGGKKEEASLEAKFGLFTRQTEVQLRKAASGGAPGLKLTGSSSGKGSQLFSKGFNFEALGIGGLNAEFQDIFRRAFASRTVPPDLLRKMGQRHVRGMLLYGPPGCGKTLIARQIGKALHAHPPKIVNGPEILNKYVGQSEENIRNLFADAEKEQAEAGDDSDLHIIIFDEFDAIAKQRGTSGGGTGVNDSIVNQLLSKIDGVDSLNNVLLIGMTNRKDMIDEAIIRPGRLEVHVEIGLPDEEGRVQILNIHTAEMRKNGLLAPDVSVPELAARTKNYTGAELEGLVKAAASYVFQRQVDPNDLSKVNTSMAAVQVTREDFERALTDLQPQFGVREDELARAFEGGIVNTGSDFERVKVTLERLVEQLKSSERSSLMSVLLTGPSGSGKTALAAKVALASGFPFVKRISGETLLNHHEGGKADAVARVFNDAYKSPLSLIILDDIERLIEYVAVGPRFSNVVLQTLLVLTKALPPKGRKLMIIGTTGIPELLDQMELASGFQLSLGMPLVTEEGAYAEVLTSVGRMPAAEASSVARFMAGKALGIKKLLAIIDMARDPAGTDPNAPVSEEAFMEALTEWGV